MSDGRNRLPDESLENHLIDTLAEEFVARLRRGERPTLSEYSHRYPQLAHEIRELFPMLVTMEQARPGSSSMAVGTLETATLRSSDGRQLDRLGDYRILREIGRGGMGIVYEAAQESLARHVALKVLPRHALLDPRQLQRFQQEARAAARLHHTNIVPVFGVGEQDGLHYYVMQFIQGLGMDQVLVELARLRRVKKGTRSTTRIEETLKSHAHCELPSPIRVAESLLSGDFQLPAEAATSAPGNGHSSAALQVGLSSSETSAASIQLPVADRHTGFSDTGRQYWHSVARIGVQVAEALAYAHAQGVLHRDIKPSNLLLDRQGTVWVTDFGLAKATDSDDLTHTGDIVGTLRYLAPERLTGRSDQRSDIYSLGITLYELLTQRPAFDETDRNKLVRQLSQTEPPRPRTIDGDIPLDLETIVLKAIAKDPADRYASPADLALDLRHFLEDKPIRARRTGALELAWRWCRRNPVIAGLAGTIVLMSLVLGIGGLIIHFLRDQRDTALVSKQRAEQAETNTRTLLSRVVAAEQEVTIRQHLAQAVAHRRSGRMGQKLACLNELTQALKLAPSPELRTELRREAIAALSLLDLQSQQEWHRPKVLNGSCDQQLKYFATVEDQSFHVTVERIEDHETVLDIRDDSVDAWHADTMFSADGKLLAIEYWPRETTWSVLDVWEVATGKRLWRQKILTFDVEIGVAIHPNNRWVIYCDERCDLCVWDVVENCEVRRMRLEFVPSTICLDRSGTRVAVNDAKDPLVKIFDLQTGEVLVEWREHVGRSSMSWSSDDQLLAIADRELVFVWDMKQHLLVSVIGERSNAINYLQFAPSGYLLATTGWDGYTRIWDAVSNDALVITEGTFCQFSSDGRQLTYINSSQERIGVWNVAHPAHRRTLHPNLRGNRNVEQIVTAERNPLGVSGVVLGDDGQLLAVSTGSGVMLQETESLRVLAEIDIGWAPGALIHPSGKYLLTWCGSGLLRWPIQRQSTAAGQHLQIGPPIMISELEAAEFWHEMHWLPGHDAVALNDIRHQQIVFIDVNAEQPQPPLAVFPSRFPRITSVSVSPDGKWLAAGGHKEPGMQVWSVPSRELVHILPPRENGRDSLFWVRFSPDNRWLVCRSHDESGRPLGYFFWDVNDWKQKYSIRAKPTGSVGIVFTPDANRMAISMSADEIMIADPRDGRQVFRLSTLPTVSSTPIAFSSDGTKLILLAYPDTLLVYDLRLLRMQLAELGLDWDEQPFPPIAEQPPRVASATVDMGDLPRRLEAYHLQKQSSKIESQALQYQRTGQWKKAFQSLDKALALNPTSARMLNQYAWLLLVCPDLELRDSQRALQLAQQAVELEPENEANRNTLGVCHYRLGNWQLAIDELSTAESLAPGKYFGHNMLFIAMSHWQLGDKELARQQIADVRKWISERSPPLIGSEADELNQFLAEADQLLGSDSR